MGKTYIYRVLGRDQYKVIRIDDKKKKGDKDRFKEYLIDLSSKSKGALCSCESFHYRKKLCKHILFVCEQLMAGGGILDFQHVGDYDRLFAAAKRQERQSAKELERDD